MASIVTPGTVIGTTSKNSPGKGVMDQDGNLVALLTGNVVENDGVISVETHNEMLRIEVGDTVIASVTKLNEKAGEAEVLSVEGKANRSIMADQQFCQFHVTRIADRFLHNAADGLRRRDIIRAKVTEAENVVRIDMREDENCGVLWALCPPCGDTFVANQEGGTKENRRVEIYLQPTTETAWNKTTDTPTETVIVDIAEEPMK